MPRATKSTASRQAAADSTDPAHESTSTAPERAEAKTSAAKSAGKKSSAAKKAPAATKEAAKKAPAAKKEATKKAPAAKKEATKKATAAKKAPATQPASTGSGSGGAAGDEQATAFDAGFLEAQRALLLEEREAHTRQAAGLRAEAEQLAEERDPGDVQFDEESGQGDTMNVERERDLALSAQAMQQVQEIDMALAKLDKGTYGLCERCGRPIPEERLVALPWAALDVGCKSMGFAPR